MISQIRFPVVKFLNTTLRRVKIGVQHLNGLLIEFLFWNPLEATNKVWGFRNRLSAHKRLFISLMVTTSEYILFYLNALPDRNEINISVEISPKNWFSLFIK